MSTFRRSQVRLAGDAQAHRFARQGPETPQQRRARYLVDAEVAAGIDQHLEEIVADKANFIGAWSWRLWPTPGRGRN